MDPGAVAPGFVSRLERFEAVESTQSVVRDWLDEGIDEVCIAVADRQTDGRGRLDRRWQAQPGRSLLASAGFRPHDLAVAHAWRLPAIASIAMLGAATSLLGPTADRLALKWPNDIVASVIVGLGVNVDWPASEFPSDLAVSMWSLSEASGGRRIDRDALLLGWLERLGPIYEELCGGHFDSLRWADAQITTGCRVEVGTGSETIIGTAVGVDHESGSLLVRIGPGIPLRTITHGDVVRCQTGDAT